jgi:rod shape-determining protein MreC
MALSTPDSEPRLFYGPGPGLRLILVLILSIALMVLDYRNQHLVHIRSLAAAAVYPLQEAVNAPFAAARWSREQLEARDQLIAENKRLRSVLLDQSGRLQRMAALEAENTRMRALLDSTAKVGDQVLIAEIVAVDMDRLRHRVVLNRGSSDGAFLGQALIDASGVVGQITRDRGASSEALLITDPDHALPVEVVRNGLRTIAVGTGDLERLSLPFMARNSDIKPGDLLVSSGLGGTFPSGYPVGTVVEVRGDSGESFLTVNAKPAAALDRVREVLLVRPGSPPPAGAQPEAPPAAPAAPAKPAAAPPPTTPRPAARPAEAAREPAPEQPVQPAQVEGARDEVRKDIEE